MEKEMLVLVTFKSGEGKFEKLKIKYEIAKNFAIS